MPEILAVLLLESKRCDKKTRRQERQKGNDAQQRSTVVMEYCSFISSQRTPPSNCLLWLSDESSSDCSCRRPPPDLPLMYLPLATRYCAEILYNKMLTLLLFNESQAQKKNVATNTPHFLFSIAFCVSDRTCAPFPTKSQ